MSVLALDARPLSIDWATVSADLDAQGWAVLAGLMSDADCDRIAALYDFKDGFRSRVVMARHGFGQGEYRYFSYPLPPIIQDLRSDLYPHLAPIANRWHERMGIRGALSGYTSSVSRSLPQRRTDAADATAAALRSGRLQLSASGSLRGACFSAANRDAAVGTRTGLPGRRIRAHRAAAADADKASRRAAHQGRRRAVRGQ